MNRKLLNRKSLIVSVSQIENESSSVCGILHCDLVRGKEVFSFEYDNQWLGNLNAFPLDPALKLFRGAQYSSHDRPNFGIFLDSSPDRWGRILMKRREALRAKEECRPVRVLLESDYLLGVYDGHRIGAFEVSIRAKGAFFRQ